MPNCRFCNTELTHIFCDLGHQPPSNSFLTKKQLDEPEVHYPLKAYVCDKCWLVQIPELKKASEIFKDDYVYHSSDSPANVSHAKEYVDMMCERFRYDEKSKVAEIGSNDGYLLQWFVKKDIPCMGIDPSLGCSEEAIKKGVKTIPKFFTSKLAKKINKLDLICSINTVAHQPDINDFVKGIKTALKPDGITTHEFPYLMKLVAGLQFDTIYHEHYNYYSLISICTIFREHGLEIFDVEEIPEHGGSLRIYAQHQGGKHNTTSRLLNLVLDEYQAGMDTVGHYQDFQSRITDTKQSFMEFIYYNYSSSLVAYGAAAKANTFLNFCGISPDLIPFIVDRSSHKQGKYLPGSHIPVVDENKLKELKPAYVLVTAWNLKEEIMEQLSYIREWGGKFVVAIPKLEVM